MIEDLTLAIDQGTRSTRAAVFDGRGRLVALARRPVALQRLSRSAIEQSADEILDSMRRVLADILEHPAIDPGRIRRAGLATQRSSVLAWERSTGRALSRVLSWQDTRTAQHLQHLSAHEAEIRQRTGLRLSPHYGAGKLHWLLEHDAATAAARRAGTLVMGPLAGYLTQHLIANGTPVVDHANAARTLLWNLDTLDWDDRLLELFAIPREVLPACRDIVEAYGITRRGGIPLSAVNGDQAAALYAQGTPARDTIRLNLGTGAFVLLPTGEQALRHPRLLTGISRSDAHSADYCIEGTVNGAGAAVDWVAKRCAVPGWAQQLPAWLEAIREPPVFLNSIGGLGAPWWRPGPAPRFISPRGPVEPDPATALVAVIESIVFLVQANIDRLRELQPDIKGITLSGGLSRSDGLCRRLADLSGLVVERPVSLEATVRGIAWLAAGSPPGWEVPDMPARFSPRTDTGLGERYARFLEALQAADQAG